MKSTKKVPCEKGKYPSNSRYIHHLYTIYQQDFNKSKNVHFPRFLHIEKEIKENV